MHSMTQCVTPSVAQRVRRMLWCAVLMGSALLLPSLSHAQGDVRIRDLTWFGVAHSTTDTDADTMLWQRSRLGGAGVVAIVGADGTLTGIVSEEQLLAVPENERDHISLQSLMVPFADVASADPDEDLSLVLSRLNPAAPIVTVWREGRLLGVVPRKRLLAKLAKPGPEPTW